MLYQIWTPVAVDLGGRRYLGYYEGRSRYGLLHKVAARKRHRAPGWDVREEQIERHAGFPDDAAGGPADAVMLT